MLTYAARSAMASLVVAALAATRAANGAEASEPIDLDYAASPGCPDRAAFEARVRADATRVRFEAAGNARRAFTIRLEQGPPAVGRLTVRNDAGDVRTREVRADTCAHAADAMALVLALAVDPTATAPVETPPSSNGAPSSPAASPPDAPEAESPTAPAAQVLAAPVPPARDRLSRPTEASNPLRALFAGADFSVATGPAPDALWALSPYVGWRRPVEGFFAPSVRASFVRASMGAIPVLGGAAAFTWTAGRVDGCGPTVTTGPASLLGCVRVEVGSLEVTGSGVPTGATSAPGWVAGGALARAEILLPVVFVDAEIAAMAHVTDDRFYFHPGVTAYQVPFLGIEASGGMGVHFP